MTLGSFWNYFGFSLVSVCVSVGDFAALDGHFAIIVESLWVYKVPFSNNIYFPTYFNSLTNSWVDCILLGVILGSLLAYEVDLEPLWGHFGATSDM